MAKREYTVTVWVTVDESQDGAPITSNGVAWSIEAALKDDKTKRMFALEAVELTEIRVTDTTETKA